MESLNNTEWDVVIVGTGLQQSLLALALSRSEKRILHVDDNDYYGGAEAAFSLQEAEDFAKRVKESAGSVFTDASLSKPETAGSAVSLSASRAYSLELSPQLLFSRSSLLQYLVSSKVFRQLEFLAVGNWWVFSPNTSETSTSGSPQHGTLLKVPSGREDVFQDQVLDFKAKRALMKFLRFISEYEQQPEEWEEYKDRPFPDFLSEKFKVPVAFHAPLLALALSASPAHQTTTGYALPRIARHLRSIGIYGPGFGAVLPKWGGMSEIVQVACRSCAVGGGVYVLGKGMTHVTGDSSDAEKVTIGLKDGETVTTSWVVQDRAQVAEQGPMCSKSITIVGSPLESLFTPLPEGAPTPASSVVVFPSGSLSLDSTSETDGELPPVYIFVHSSDTGECPVGQSVLYAFTSLVGDSGFQLLSKATDYLLSSVDVAPRPSVLWSLQYAQRSASSPSSPSANTPSCRVLDFPGSSLDLAFDDSVLERVKGVWQKIMGDDVGEFLAFEDREGQQDDDED